MQPELPNPFGSPYQSRRNAIDFYNLAETVSFNDDLYKGTEGMERKYRTIIYPKDVQMIYDQPESFAREVLLYIRESLGHSHREPVTIDDFADFSGLDHETLLFFIHASCLDKHFLCIEFW